MDSLQDTAEAVGCPIRTSMDQSPFAAPHGFSQRTTSFIASQRQGIHQMPLRRLIALISQCPDPPNRGITGIGKTSCIGFASPPHRREGVAVKPAPPHAQGMRHGKSNPFFTMSNSTIDRSRRINQTCLLGRFADTDGAKARGAARQHLVEPDGIEPTTSCLQSRRSPN